MLSKIEGERMIDRRLFEVWNFVSQYRDLLNFPVKEKLTFDKFVFFNQASVGQLHVDRVLDPAAPSRSNQPNVFRYLFEFLTTEESKRVPTMRRLLREPNWRDNIYNVIYRASYVDDCNFESYIRGYYDRSAYKIRLLFQ